MTDAPINSVGGTTPQPGKAEKLGFRWTVGVNKSDVYQRTGRRYLAMAAA
jgi:hypothetical protein